MEGQTEMMRSRGPVASSVTSTGNPVNVVTAAVEPIGADGLSITPPPTQPRWRRWFRWWMPNLTAAVVLFVLTVHLFLSSGGYRVDIARDAGWWVTTAALHLPFALILFFLAAGLVERLGYFWRGRRAEPAGRLPAVYPSVCVQLPMFNEHAVAARIIEAASALKWPVDRLTVQVLDDSTDEDTLALVDAICARVRARTGIDCHVQHRTGRQGYKAGALEAGRRITDAEFLVVFDADFLPPPDYLLRVIPYFYDADGIPEAETAMVQAQWGHLNHDESALTQAQSLWVDDHHTLQMAWRSAKWKFVNFTGTAGVWRASAVEAAGGWRAASLVEDCELSFRHLFAGYRTRFVKEIVVPAELPATFTAYKAQQKRWTQGWVQLQRLHLRTLLFQFPCSLPRRLHLVYHMCIPWQWPLWALWITLLPIMIYTGHWFGGLGTATAVTVYFLPTTLWVVTSATIASLETRHTYAEPLTRRSVARRLARIVPYVIINTGMLPHQFCAFTEGLFGSLHSEFERTPKSASVTRSSATVSNPRRSLMSARSYSVKVHWPYVLTEAMYLLYQLTWVVVFAANGLLLCALGAAFIASCVLYLGFFYGDHAGKVLFVVDKDRLKRLIPGTGAGTRTGVKSRRPLAVHRESASIDTLPSARAQSEPVPSTPIRSKPAA
jgi:cellulose synthase/poly-beta-1,6-N-acetylglucosamine synthase-like glycosyltransferase